MNPTTAERELTPQAHKRCMEIFERLLASHALDIRAVLSPKVTDLYLLIEAGWQARAGAVPREPTPEMERAGVDLYAQTPLGVSPGARALWQAMWDKWRESAPLPATMVRSIARVRELALFVGCVDTPLADSDSAALNAVCDAAECAAPSPPGPSDEANQGALPVAQSDDTARMDWIELHGVEISLASVALEGAISVTWHRGQSFGESLRAAVDHAMQRSADVFASVSREGLGDAGEK